MNRNQKTTVDRRNWKARLFVRQLKARAICEEEHKKAGVSVAKTLQGLLQRA